MTSCARSLSFNKRKRLKFLESGRLSYVNHDTGGGVLKDGAEEVDVVDDEDDDDDDLHDDDDDDDDGLHDLGDGGLHHGELDEVEQGDEHTGLVKEDGRFASLDNQAKRSSPSSPGRSAFLRTPGGAMSSALSTGRQTTTTTTTTSTGFTTPSKVGETKRPVGDRATQRLASPYAYASAPSASTAAAAAAAAAAATTTTSAAGAAASVRIAGGLSQPLLQHGAGGLRAGSGSSASSGSYGSTSPVASRGGRDFVQAKVRAGPRELGAQELDDHSQGRHQGEGRHTSHSTRARRRETRRSRHKRRRRGKRVESADYVLFESMARQAEDQAEFRREMGVLTVDDDGSRDGVSCCLPWLSQ